MVSSTPGRTLPPGKIRYPFYRRLGGPQGRSGRAENLVPSGIRSRTVQPVAQVLYRLSYRPTLSFYYNQICTINVTTIYITTVSLYVIYTRTCFDISMSSSGSSIRPGRTLPPGKTEYQFYGRLGGTQGRFGRVENVVPTGIQSRTFQPVVTRYTD